MNPPRQLVLPLPQSASFAANDYYVSESNRPAHEAVVAWPAWPGRMLAVIGPAGAGKSHLAALHRARVREAGRAATRWPSTAADHLIVEDVDGVVGAREAEEALFHAFNRMATAGSILFTARAPIAAWPVHLPDLRTRLNTVVAVDLPAPDDALLYAVLLKLFADRQIDPETSADTAAWLVPRMDRSLAAAGTLVADLDAKSLSEKRKIDRRLAAELLSPDLGL